MFLKKHGAPGTPLRMRNTVDLRERNANTKKLASPLPDQQAVLYCVSSHRYVTLMDGQDAYEQIRIEPDDIKHTLMTTPDGTLESLVMQQGDCNAVATFMTLMTRLFSQYLTVCMDIYLDDIVIYNTNLAEHVKTVKMVIDILRREKFYLAENKLFFLPKELKLLGHVITRDGIRIDPHKIDTILNWKTPTNRDLLRGFIGTVGYVSDGVEAVCIALGPLQHLTGDSVAFRWHATEQRCFDTVKQMVHEHREVKRVAMKHGDDAPCVWLVGDGCCSGVAGTIRQGDDWQTAPIIAFYSAKLSTTQQNYAVHEIELLAGLETMMRYRDLLLGVHFTWCTDHKELEYLLNQKNLTGRQARWISKMSEFDFDVMYIPGKLNTVADALSRIYSADEPGTIRAESEFVQHDTAAMRVSSLHSVPMQTGTEARYALRARKAKAPEVPAETGRPETSKEFAKRIKKVVLQVGERPEGEKAVSGSKPNLNTNQRLESNQSVDIPEPEYGPAPELIGYDDPSDADKDAPADMVSTIPSDGLPFTIRKKFRSKLGKLVTYAGFERRGDSLVCCS
jgi:hypothetical protein